MCSLPHLLHETSIITHGAYVQFQQTGQASKSSTQDVVIRRNLPGHCDWQIRVAQLFLRICVCVCVCFPLENMWQADYQMRVTPRCQMKWHLAVQFWQRFTMQHTETKQARNSWLVTRDSCVVIRDSWVGGSVCRAKLTLSSSNWNYLTVSCAPLHVALCPYASLPAPPTASFGKHLAMSWDAVN